MAATPEQGNGAGRRPTARRREADARRVTRALRDCAILHLDVSERLPGRRWPREVAVEFLAGPATGGTLCWLVAPEAFWPRPPGEAVPGREGASPGPGQGAPIERVARELAAALRGFRVHAENHSVVGGWVAALFAAAGLGTPPFAVLDVSVLIDGAQPTGDDVLRAGRTAVLAAGSAWRAPCQAVRQAAYVRTLTALSAIRTGAAFAGIRNGGTEAT